MRKCWRFVLSLSVLVALLFSGCAKDNPPDSGAESTDAESASETGTVEELPDPLRLVSDGKSDYVIIYRFALQLLHGTEPDRGGRDHAGHTG